jgi:hypothetical protein
VLCDSDEEAIAEAKRLVDRHGIVELSCADRLVATLPREAP